MAGKVTDRDYGWAALLERLGVLTEETPGVLIGVSSKAGSEVVMIAAVNEFGSDDGHVPERSYLRATVDERPAEIADDLEAAVGAILDGGDPETELGRVGEKWVGEVKQKILNRIDPPNAPRTIAQKGSDVPLVDTTTHILGRLDWELE